MNVETGKGAAIRPAGDTTEVERLAPDVLIVGSGPAGLTAALAAQSCGLDVLLVDERTSLGGQYFKPLAPSHRFVPPASADEQFRTGRQLTDAVTASAITCRTGTTVWGAWHPLELAAFSGNRSLLMAPKRLILATGAFERAMPIPGWTLPGCMTSGAAQMLVRSNRVSPGRKVVVSGNGPLNLQVAAELVAGGVDVTVAEASNPFAPRRFSSLLGMAVADPRLAADGVNLAARLRNRILYSAAAIAVHGTDAVSAVTLARIDHDGKPVPGTDRTIDADAVCLGYGFWPSNEIARALGCRHEFDPAGMPRPHRDENCQSSVNGVYIAGDSAGLGGAKAAMQEGAVAGYEAARSLLGTLPPLAESKLTDARSRLHRQSRFQRHLWRAFARPQGWLRLATDETEICRCEGVTLGRIRSAIEQGAGAIGSLKRETRAGMGPCQGRYCSPLLRDLIGASEGPSDEDGLFAPRPPARPVPFGLAAVDTAE